MAEAIRPVGGDVEVDDRDASGLDGRDLESAQSNLRRDPFRIVGNGDELGKPGLDDSHSGNCSRKRRSFS